MLDSVPTETIAVNATRPGVVRRDAGLILDETVEAEPADVDVTLSFGVKRKDVWIKTPVAVDAPEGVSARPRPDTVQLQINTPVNMLEGEKIKDMVRVEVRLGPDVETINDVFPYHVELPGGVRLIKSVPERVEIVFE
jgi:hypothetical protein